MHTESETRRDLDRPAREPRSRGLRWWGLGIGAVGGVLDTAFFLWMGLDLTVAGRDLTALVAVYLAASFAALGFALGYLLDARARERRDAQTIRDQMRELEASRRAVIQNEKLAAIGRVAAGVAHEVRNPLGVIRASAALLEESSATDEEGRRACVFICEEIDRLNGLITSLLSFARPSELRRRSVRLDEVIDRALRIQGDELERRGIELARETPDSLPAIAADPDLLSQVVLGLLTNATEALERGGRIAVRVASDPAAVHLQVADSGPGVPSEDAERVFEPFFTTKASGTGLGLAMTARIVQAHGGRIEVETGAGVGPEGRGACFHVRLPVAEPTAEAA